MVPQCLWPLYSASHLNNPDVVALLLAGGASAMINLAEKVGGLAPLYVVSEKNNIAVTKQLLAAGTVTSRDATVTGHTPLEVTKHFKQTAAVELLEAWPLLSQYPLMVAAVMRQDVEVRKLLQSGEDPIMTVQHNVATRLGFGKWRV